VVRQGNRKLQHALGVGCACSSLLLLLLLLLRRRRRRRLLRRLYAWVTDAQLL
jgi:hypothetical protein